MRVSLGVIIFAICLIISIGASPETSPRIVGGSVTTISQWPYVTSLLYSWNAVTYSQACGGSILTTTAILTAGHCVAGDGVNLWRVRVGSSYANSGGTVYILRQINVHPSYNGQMLDNDVAVLRTSTNIGFITNSVQPGTIAGTGYVLADNQVVWTVGWGVTSIGGAQSEQLRQVQIWTVNQSICKNRYAELGLTVTDNMLCSGWLDVGGRDQCSGDSGGPLIHNNVIVGVCSWGQQCATARYPGVNTRVSRYTSWIQAAAS